MRDGTPHDTPGIGMDRSHPAPPMRDNDLLLRELHHRCGNDLQLIVSLLDLQSRRSASEETRAALGETINRVRILARARSALNGGAPASLAAGIAQVCEGLQAHAEPRAILISTEVEGAAHGLSPTQITTLSLVVNELATNAIKHAFDDGAGGNIRIRIGATSACDVTVIVEDDGKPFPLDLPRAGTGLGFDIVRRLMASIDGLFIMPPAGSKMFELRLPVSGG